MLLAAVEWTHVLVILIQFLFIIGIFFLSYKICKYAFQKIKNLLSANGVSTLSTFLSLGVSVLIFYNTFNALVVNIGNFLSDTIQGLSIYLTAANAESSTITELTHSIFNSLNEHILTIPIVSLFVICCCLGFCCPDYREFCEGGRERFLP